MVDFHCHVQFTGGTGIQIHAPAPSQANHLVRAIEYTSSDDAVRLPSVCPWWKDVKNLTDFFLQISTSKQPWEIRDHKVPD